MKTVKLVKATAIAACASMLFAIPVFADNGQSSQYTMNQMPFQNGMQSQKGTQGQQMQGGQQENGQAQNQNLSNAAQYMVSKGIIKGDTSGNYSMSSSVKRCDMSVMLTRAFNLSTTSTSGSNFSDVERGSYYADAVNAMRQLGIAQGDGQNFNPNRTMTLEEAILFVQRALDVAEIDYSAVDLEDLFSGRSLSEAATREDVSAILYAVLGDDYTDYLPSSTSAVKVTYTTEEGTAISFDEDDFNDVCEDATDETLSYIKFTLPSASYGKLYYGYEDEDDYTGKVSAGSKYYYDPDDDDLYSISDVTFVPKDGYTGTVKIAYTGWNEDGDSFTGTIKIKVD